MNTMIHLNENELAAVVGGGLREHPQYDVIKAFYKERGTRSAVTLGTYYGLTVTESWDLVNIIMDEVERGV